MRDGKRNDPYGQFNFLIEIDGVGKGGFSEASGLTTDSNIIEYREGNGNADGQATTRFEYTVNLVPIADFENLGCPSYAYPEKPGAKRKNSTYTKDPRKESEPKPGLDED
jgi:hypothetical protein